MCAVRKFVGPRPPLRGRHGDDGRVRAGATAMSVEQAQREGDPPYIPAMVPGGRLVFVSCQTPFRNGVLPKGGIEEQTNAAIENIAGVLETVGASLVDVIRCGVFMADLYELPGLNTAYAKAFGSQIPTRTAVGAALPGYKVEIDCIALVPSN